MKQRNKGPAVALYSYFISIEIGSTLAVALGKDLRVRARGQTGNPHIHHVMDILQGQINYNHTQMSVPDMFHRPLSPESYPRS